MNWFRSRGSYAVTEECLICFVLIAPTSHDQHLESESHQRNVDALLAKIAQKDYGQS